MYTINPRHPFYWLQLSVWSSTRSLWFSKYLWITHLLTQEAWHIQSKKTQQPHLRPKTVVQDDNLRPLLLCRLTVTRDSITTPCHISSTNHPPGLNHRQIVWNLPHLVWDQAHLRPKGNFGIPYARLAFVWSSFCHHLIPDTVTSKSLSNNVNFLNSSETMTIPSGCGKVEMTSPENKSKIAAGT